MSKIIGGLILLGVGLLGYVIYNYYQSIEEKKQVREELVVTAIPDLDYRLQDSYEKAKAKGSKGLGEWLKLYNAGVPEPRKSWNELDYVVLLASDNPKAAKELFAQIKARTPTTSPVYARIQKLSKTFD
jgi:hypothetical protein